MALGFSQACGLFYSDYSSINTCAAAALTGCLDSVLMPQNYQNYIAGAWCDGDATIENINPSDLNDSIGHYAQAGHRQLNDVMDAAASAQKQWAKTGLEARQTILICLLYTSPSPRDGLLSRMPSSA